MSSLTPLSRSPSLAIQNAAATTIQAAWRGFKVRSIYHTIKDSGYSDCGICYSSLFSEDKIVKLDQCCHKIMHETCLLNWANRITVAQYRCPRCNVNKLPTDILSRLIKNKLDEIQTSTSLIQRARNCLVRAVRTTLYACSVLLIIPSYVIILQKYLEMTGGAGPTLNHVLESDSSSGLFILAHLATYFFLINPLTLMAFKNEDLARVGVRDSNLIFLLRCFAGSLLLAGVTATLNLLDNFSTP